MNSPDTYSPLKNVEESVNTELKALDSRLKSLLSDIDTKLGDSLKSIDLGNYILELQCITHLCLCSTQLLMHGNQR